MVVVVVMVGSCCLPSRAVEGRRERRGGPGAAEREGKGKGSGEAEMGREGGGRRVGVGLIVAANAQLMKTSVNRVGRGGEKDRYGGVFSNNVLVFPFLSFLLFLK
jgi:hypothetical protein